MHGDQATRLRALVQQPKSDMPHKVVLVTSARTGRGVTTVATYLTISLARRGLTVGLIDAAPNHANNGRSSTNLWNFQSARGWVDWLTGAVALDKVVVEPRPNLLFVPYGTPGDKHPPEITSEKCQELRCLWSDNRFRADLVFVDLGAASGAGQQTLWPCADEVLLVTTVDSQSVLETYAVLKTLCKSWSQDIRLVVNRAEGFEQARSVMQGMRQVSHRFLGKPITCEGWLPESASLADAVGLEGTDTGFTRAVECLSVACLARLPGRHAPETQPISA